jgi:hypothetical protein
VLPPVDDCLKLKFGPGMLAEPGLPLYMEENTLGKPLNPAAPCLYPPPNIFAKESPPSKEDSPNSSDDIWPPLLPEKNILNISFGSIFALCAAPPDPEEK